MSKRVILKRYAIHILSVSAIDPDTFDLPEVQYALILCTRRTNRYLDLEKILYKIVIPFPDAEDKTVPGAYNSAHARAIVRFLLTLPESVTDLFIVCSKGGSRSTALAAAILKASGRSDDVIWNNPFYVPNTLVYQRTCRELGIFMPFIAVKLKKWKNDRQFKKAKKRKNSGNYERWMIIN